MASGLVVPPGWGGGSWTGELQADGGGLAYECEHAAPQGVSPFILPPRWGIGELRERSPPERLELEAQSAIKLMAALAWIKLMAALA